MAMAASTTDRPQALVGLAIGALGPDRGRARARPGPRGAAQRQPRPDARARRGARRHRRRPPGRARSPRSSRRSSFDFFLTRPYLSLKIETSADLETALILLGVGLLVGRGVVARSAVRARPRTGGAAITPRAPCRRAASRRVRRSTEVVDDRHRRGPGAVATSRTAGSSSLRRVTAHRGCTAAVGADRVDRWTRGDPTTASRGEPAMGRVSGTCCLDHRARSSAGRPPAPEPPGRRGLPWSDRTDVRPRARARQSDLRRATARAGQRPRQLA